MTLGAHAGSNGGVHLAHFGYSDVCLTHVLPLSALRDLADRILWRFWSAEEVERGASHLGLSRRALTVGTMDLLVV